MNLLAGRTRRTSSLSLGPSGERTNAALAAVPDATVSTSRGTTRGGAPLEPFTVDPDLMAAANWPVSRDTAWGCPAAAQGLQLIAGTLGSMPLARYRGLRRLKLPALLAQPDPEEPASATFTRLIEDLILYPDAFLLVLERGADGFPMSARYVEHERIADADLARDPDDPLAAPTKQYRIDGEVLVPASEVIRFPAHWPGLLCAGASALRTSRLLELAAQRYADVDAPAGALRNAGADLPPDKVDEMLSTWERARKARTIAYLNSVMSYETYSWKPEELQLVEGRRWQTTEIARVMNLPPKYVNADSSSNLTYANVESERRDLVDLSFRPYIAAVEGRLSMNDVCPRGQNVQMILDDFYRADLATRASYYVAALGPNGWLTRDEVRALERRLPLGPGTSPTDEGTPDGTQPAP
jgi:HK97 family phage portal protein